MIRLICKCCILVCCLTLISLFPITLSAQVEIGDKGKVGLSLGGSNIAEMMGRQLQEIASRRLQISPTEVNGYNTTNTKVEISLTNNYTDTALVHMQLHGSPPKSTIMPEKKSVADTTIDKLNQDQPKRSLIAVDSPDTASEFHNLIPWVVLDSSPFKLAPGETKVVSATINLPDDATAGKYLGWVAAHVTVVDGLEDSKSSEGDKKESESDNNRSALRKGMQIISHTKVEMTK